MAGAGDENPTVHEPDSMLLTDRPLINNEQEHYPDQATDNDEMYITAMQTNFVTSNSE